MAVGRDLRFIDAAVDSILGQEFRDFEFIIVNDGSGEDAVFAKLLQRDPRIRILTNATNLGAPAATNRGIAAARGDIIVRLDADDIAAPSRIGKLVAAFDAEPDLGLVGSWYTQIDETGMPHGVVHRPESDLLIRWTILFYNPFCHSSVAFRRRCFEATRGYRTDQPVSYDHYLWADLLETSRARNLPEPLVYYRINSRGLAATNRQNWRARTHEIRVLSWARLGVPYDLYDDECAGDIADFISGKAIARVEGRTAAYRTILRLLRPFLASRLARAREAEQIEARQLATTTTARVLAALPEEFRSTIAICRLTWPLNRRGTIKALTGCLVSQCRHLGHAFWKRLSRLFGGSL
jgi:glycosyltransferase involved in cell wall biosynthesis